MKKKEVKEYLKRHDISIQGNIATWSISAIGDIHGKYLGTFTFKCFLTPTEKLSCGRLYRDLLGPNAALAFSNEDNLAFSLSQLKFRIIEAPPFWTSAVGINGITGDLPDEKIIDTVLAAAIDSELKYKAILEQKKEEVIKQAKQAAEDLLARKDKQPEEEELGDED